MFPYTEDSPDKVGRGQKQQRHSEVDSEDDSELDDDALEDGELDSDYKDYRR